METLRDELMAYIREQYLREDADSYKQVALSFLHFARQEKNLFQLVYLRQRAPGETFLRTPTPSRPCASWKRTWNFPVSRPRRCTGECNTTVTPWRS